MTSVRIRMCIETHCNASLRGRVQWFSGWRGWIDPEKLAEAGFYYLGEDDNTRCYYCGVIIHEWRARDDPIQEHLHWQSNCQFAKFIDSVQRLKRLLQIKKGNLESSQQLNRLLPDQYPNLWMRRQQNDLSILHTNFLLLLIDYNFLLWLKPHT